jgi:hypothetical protein
MGVALHLANYGTQAETLAGIEAGAFETTIVPGQRLGLAIFQKKLAIVGMSERIRRNSFDSGQIQPGLVEEYLIGKIESGHWDFLPGL